MAASLKSTGSRIRGIHQLKSKITTLQTQYQKLLTHRQQDIASRIATLDLADMDDQLLMGGLIFLKEKITTQDPIMENWRNAGERFLRKTKPKRQSTSKPTAPSSSSNQSP